MNNMILYSGYALVALGVIVLAIMATYGLRMHKLSPNERKNQIQRLVVMNFSGIGLALIGLMMIVMSSFF